MRSKYFTGMERMHNGKSLLALIPARGGSKGLPGKNLRPLAGKPLIAWTIEQALRCPAIDRVIVSTDDPAIAETATQWGAEVPFLRPSELAADDSRMVDVVLHALDWDRANNQSWGEVMLLQATSPLRELLDIKASLARMDECRAEAIVSVCPCEHSPMWANTLGPNGRMNEFLRMQTEGNRQDLPTYYRLNGAIYLARTDYFRRCGGFYGEQTYAVIMPNERSIDIDSPLDFELAEFLIGRTMGTQVR
jgi:CMP-N,N'-diacetyllegionaminic acid synthase